MSGYRDQGPSFANTAVLDETRSPEELVGSWLLDNKVWSQDERFLNVWPRDYGKRLAADNNLLQRHHDRFATTLVEMVREVTESQSLTPEQAAQLTGAVHYLAATTYEIREAERAASEPIGRILLNAGPLTCLAAAVAFHTREDGTMAFLGGATPITAADYSVGIYSQTDLAALERNTEAYGTNAATVFRVAGDLVERLCSPTSAGYPQAVGLQQQWDNFAAAGRNR